MILSLIGIGMAISMFFLKREWKITLILVALICFSLVNVPLFPRHNLRIVLCYMFFLSELKHIKAYCKTLGKSVIWKVLAIQLIATVISYATSPHYRFTFEGIKTYGFELLSCNILIAYAYISVKNRKSLKIVLKGTFSALLILTFFAILNLLFRKADFVTYAMSSMMTDVNDVNALMGEKFTYSDRFRVQAMFFNPFDYGYMCLMILSLHLYGFIKKLEQKEIFYIVLACCLFGVLVCGCRTMILCLFIGIATFWAMAFKVGKIIKYGFAAVVVGILLYSYVPYVQEKVNQTMSAFSTSGSQEVKGSSIQMRIIQTATVLYYIQGHELFGRGKNFFLIDMGFNQGKEGLLDKSLEGLEGIYLKLLLENGIIGFSLWIIFYSVLIRYFLKNRKNDKITSSIGMTVIVLYISFSSMTGQLLSLYPTMIITGFLIKMMEVNKRRIFIHSKRVASRKRKIKKECQNLQ